jgi:phage repressor protein C with HTH and peptisase S24 domain
MIDIYKERKKLGLTQKQFAAEIGVSYQTVQNWEKGGKIPEARLRMLKSFIHTGNEKPEDFDYDEEQLKREGLLDIYENKKHIENKKAPTGYYYPNVSAAAGMDKEMQNDELKRLPINLPNWDKGIDFINVYGDSMYPKFCSGEIIGIKEVELQYMNFGYAYVVILKDEQVLLKYIKKGSDKEHIILESENDFYEPKEYHLEQIKKVFIIKGVITKTTM